AAPLSASSFPNIAPSTMSTPTPPSTSPTPSRYVSATSSRAMPLAIPTNSEPIVNDRKACILNLTIRTTTMAIPITVTTSAWVSWPAHASWISSTASSAANTPSEFNIVRLLHRGGVPTPASCSFGFLGRPAERVTECGCPVGDLRPVAVDDIRWRYNRCSCRYRGSTGREVVRSVAVVDTAGRHERNLWERASQIGKVLGAVRPGREYFDHVRTEFRRGHHFGWRECTEYHRSATRVCHVDNVSSLVRHPGCDDEPRSCGDRFPCLRRATDRARTDDRPGLRRLLTGSVQQLGQSRDREGQFDDPDSARCECCYERDHVVDVRRPHHRQHLVLT